MPPAASRAAIEVVLIPSVLTATMISRTVSEMDTKLVMNEAIALSVPFRLKKRCRMCLMRRISQAPIR